MEPQSIIDYRTNLRICYPFEQQSHFGARLADMTVFAICLTISPSESIKSSTHYVVEPSQSELPYEGTISL